MIPLENLLHQSGMPTSIISLAITTITPDRFWESGGFLVAEYLTAVRQRLRLWGFDILNPPTVVDDAGWKKAIDAGFRGKVWLTQSDDRVRGRHRLRHKEERHILERFSIQFVGWPGPMYPRDPACALGDTVNCRCKLAFLL